MKRGQSGLSLLVGVNKPLGMTSHDVVNKCRRIFNERRVGHTGTLDPLASGVLPVCVGPATRLDKYLVGHDKEYLVGIRFGWETTTDDAEGEVSRASAVSLHLEDEDFARSYLAAQVGTHEQIPPAYSAIKVNGQTAYKLARSGNAADLKPRIVEVLAAELRYVDRDEDGHLIWHAAFTVSKGTYIRALARDIGRNLGSAAHVASLERTRAGRISLMQSVTIETLEHLGVAAALDPIRVLGIRYGFVDDIAGKVSNGKALFADELELFESLPVDTCEEMCACSTTLAKSDLPPTDCELVAAIAENRLSALYAFDIQRGMYVPECVFSIPVSRC